MSYGYQSINVKDVGCYKFINIDHIKSPEEKLQYKLKGQDPIIFFEWYKTDTFEEESYTIPALNLREKDVPDLIQPF